MSILIINSGSSSLKFAVYGTDDPPLPSLTGKIERIGSHEPNFIWKDSSNHKSIGEPVAASDSSSAAAFLIDWIDKKIGFQTIAAVGHRIVHGGPKYDQPQRVTPDLMAELRRLAPYDPEHSPAQIQLIEAFQKHSPTLPQITCFDTAFHQTMPRAAKILPVPRKYEAKGVRRYGFHGLSYTYLVEELARVAGAEAARQRLILAHLGNGASMAAVRDGHSIDTSMAFTPTAGLPMSTRTGDLDPGVFYFLANNEQMTAAQFQHMANHESGLLGISETSSDVRELEARATGDIRAAEALGHFCYQAKKWVGAFAAALGGVDTLVFAGGIGENSPSTRARICEGLDFLDIALDQAKNQTNFPIISAEGRRVTVRVMRTNEEIVMAKAVCKILRA